MAAALCQDCCLWDRCAEVFVRDRFKGKVQLKMQRAADIIRIKIRSSKV